MGFIGKTQARYEVLPTRQLEAELPAALLATEPAPARPVLQREPEVLPQPTPDAAPTTAG